eukprot:1889480-Rhodomonas_salina.1
MSAMSGRVLAWTGASRFALGFNTNMPVKLALRTHSLIPLVSTRPRFAIQRFRGVRMCKEDEAAQWKTADEVAS